MRIHQFRAEIKHSNYVQQNSILKFPFLVIFLIVTHFPDVFVLSLLRLLSLNLTYTCNLFI